MFGIYQHEDQDEAGREAEAEKTQRLLMDPILKPLLEDLCQWLGRILEIKISPDNFWVPLQTGDDLCRLALGIAKKAEEMGMKCPTLRFKSGAKAGSFQARCNIEAFLKWAKDLGVRETCLFETADIVELKFIRNVLICMLEISRLADRYGVEPPELVKLEKSTKIRWQDLIKLSMKRSSGGKVLSVAAISTTVGEIQNEVNKADEEGIELERSSSAVKRWKSFTKSSLISRGGIVSPDPSKILDEMQSSPRFGTPDSMLSSSFGSPEPRMDILEDEATSSGDIAVSPTTGSSISGRAASIGSVTAASPDVDIDMFEAENMKKDVIPFERASPKEQFPDRRPAVDIVADYEAGSAGDIAVSAGSPISGRAASIGSVTAVSPVQRATPKEQSSNRGVDFEDITEGLDSDKTEVVLSLEEGTFHDDDEDMVCEDLPMDGVELELELETEDIALGDQDINISVEQNLVEAVHSQPDFGSPDVALELETEDMADDQDLNIHVEQHLVEAVHATPEYEAADGVEARPARDVAVEVEQVAIVVDASTPVEASTSDEEYSSDSLSEDEEDEEYLPVSSGPQLEIETKEDVPVEEELVVEPIVYETKDRVIPSAPVMEILVHSATKDDPEQQDGRTNPACEGDSIESRQSQVPSTSVSPPTSSSVPQVASGGEGEGEGEGNKVDITWWFALCYPAVFSGNKDGSRFSQEQVEELEFKRSVYLLCGIIFTIIGTALGVTDAVLGINDGSGAEDIGILTPTWFFVIFGFAVACLIIGLSLIALWVVQNMKMRQKKRSSFEKATDYGAIR
ncbi:uncharacterized protein LOC134824114 isoform X2 [Bolinopsis microptera]|uniref:uncharacterized protein LOC134824114 isoform X2 n=1 Tax=Bolinopsis microptera TaxID=2820187 RepID=UPI00307977CE